MGPLPLPPPPPGAAGADLQRRSRPGQVGQVTSGWRATFVIGWAGVLLGLAAIVKSSRTMGLSTWWLGPESSPNFVAVMALPFVIGVVMVVLGFRNVRYLPVYGVGGALALAAIGAGDLGRFDALAQVELATAGVGLLVSVAAFAGILRPAGVGQVRAGSDLPDGVTTPPAHTFPPPPGAAPPPITSITSDVLAPLDAPAVGARAPESAVLEAAPRDPG